MEETITISDKKLKEILDKYNIYISQYYECIGSHRQNQLSTNEIIKIIKNESTT